MRTLFSKTVQQIMSENENVFFLTADLGYPFLNGIREKFNDRFINVGAAEQSLFDIAVGLALSKKYPICYTITPFILRGLETLRTYVDHEIIPMLIVGSGRNKEYLRDGISHWATDTDLIFNGFDNIRYVEPLLYNIERDLYDIIASNIPTIITLNK